MTATAFLSICLLVLGQAAKDSEAEPYTAFFRQREGEN